MELWLVRHGLTDANLEGRLQGQLDFPLNSDGVKQATLLGKRLQRTAFAFCFSSPLLRARQTAQIVMSASAGPPPLFAPVLLEYHWGVIQGLTRTEVKQRFPRLNAQLETNFYHTPIPGAEGLPRLFRRIEKLSCWLSRLEKTQSVNKPVLLVSHGRFLHGFMLYCLGYDYRKLKAWPFPMDNASITVLESSINGGGRLKLFNDRCHLND